MLCFFSSSLHSTPNSSSATLQTFRATGSRKSLKDIALFPQKVTFQLHQILFLSVSLPFCDFSFFCSSSFLLLFISVTCPFCCSSFLMRHFLSVTLPFPLPFLSVTLILPFSYFSVLLVFPSVTFPLCYLCFYVILLTIHIIFQLHGTSHPGPLSTPPNFTNRYN